MAHIVTRPSWQLPESEATSEAVFRDRRRILKQMGLGAIAAAGALSPLRAFAQDELPAPPAPLGPPFPDFTKPDKFKDAGRKITPEELATGYNNFYEFSFQKHLPRYYAKDFRLNPYVLKIDGLVDNPIEIGLEEIEKLGLEQRVYRFRCVEAWSMTVPWIGVPLHKLLKKAGVKPEATHVRFLSFLDKEQAPNQRLQTQYPWPYYEGLTVEEAMNELALVTTGHYGKRLAPQSGTPLRVVLPWKYGFKGPKSVVHMTLTDSQPKTFWNDLIPNEYGFTANVNPGKPHPRWSQATERDIETGERIPTLMLNGYEEYVAKLYS